MSKSPLDARKPSNDRVLEAVSDATRRAVVSEIRERSTPVAVGDLATTVTATLEGAPLVDVTREDRKPIHAALVNVHLPKLDDAELIEWDRDEEFVTAADHPAFEDRRLRRLLAVETDDWDAVLESLCNSRRRHVLSVLEATEEALDRRTLARRVAARENGVAPPEVPGLDVDDALRSLHHVHLPKLQQAGLVADDDESTWYIGHPELQREWLAFEPETLSEPRADAESVPDVRSLEGRDAVIGRGQALIDRADEELFLMITTDGLLEEACVRKLQAALDRGVDVYLGSQTTEVRDLVRERVPEATIWEPQLDWLNLPPNHERLGRLVFADREAIMLGTLGDLDEEGVARETAITGEGPDNSLVVLMRELLGSRLDHLDLQSEDVLSQLPL